MTDIGSINSESGQTSGGPLTGIDVPTLRDAWLTAPYLHNGSAATLAEAIQAHTEISPGTNDTSKVIRFIQQIGGDAIPEAEPTPPDNSGGANNPNSGGSAGSGSSNGGGTAAFELFLFLLIFFNRYFTLFRLFLFKKRLCFYFSEI